MITAKVFKQGDPVPSGRGYTDGMECTIYAANLIFLGTVQGVTSHECWHRAKALTPAPALEFVK